MWLERSYASKRKTPHNRNHVAFKCRKLSGNAGSGRAHDAPSRNSGFKCKSILTVSAFLIHLNKLRFYPDRLGFSSDDLCFFGIYVLHPESPSRFFLLRNDFTESKLSKLINIYRVNIFIAFASICSRRGGAMLLRVPSDAKRKRHATEITWRLNLWDERAHRV